MTDTAAALRLEQVRKIYGAGEATVTALDEVSLSFRRGSFTAVMGPSGSGKTTLLQCAAGLVAPSSGRVWLDGQAIEQMPEKKLARVRRERIGFVFQSFNLLPALTAMENITLPFRLARTTPDPARLAELLRVTGIAAHVQRRPHELSGGQQQRVAVCRALAPRPRVLFADEPTGNLDTKAGNEVLRLLRKVVDELEQTVIMVTHDPTAAMYAESVVFLADGRIVEITGPLPAEQIATRLTHLGEDRMDFERIKPSTTG